MVQREITPEVISGRPPLVLKLGGSVLTGVDAYTRAATFLASQLSPASPRLVVVVSAELGQTDALLREAVGVAAEPGADALDLLWSTGELRSVALLTLALRAAGVSAVGLNAHETGLRSTDGRVELNAIALRSAIARHDVVVVPGFLATRDHQVVTLGRGGSDLSAVFVAAALGASRCALIKDVDGYFTADPHAIESARPIATLNFDEALRMADDGCPLVQRQALAAARDARITLIVRSTTSTGTLVSVSH